MRHQDGDGMEESEAAISKRCIIVIASGGGAERILIGPCRV